MIRLLQTEWFKLRKPGLLIPFAAAVMLTAMTGGLWYFNYREGPGGAFSIFAVQFFFLSITMMLSITIISSIAASVEHESGGWKHLCALPVSRIKIWASKFLIVYTLAALETALVIAGTVLLWKLAVPDAIPWDIVVRQPVYCLLSAAGFTAIQVWLSTVFSNQSIAIGAGVSGAVAGFFLARSQLEATHYLPWAYPTLATPLIPGHLTWIVLGAAIAVVVLATGALHFKRIEW